MPKLPKGKAARKVDKKIAKGGKSAGKVDPKIYGDRGRKIFKSESKRMRNA